MTKVPQTFANDPETIAKLERLSKQRNVSVSSIICEALDLYFNHHEQANHGKTTEKRVFSKDTRKQP